MQDIIPDQKPAAPVCVACVGDGTDPVTGGPCLRCKGSRTDPDPAASVLTDRDKRALAEARELAAVPACGIREFTGEDDGHLGRAVALARAQILLADLAAVVERRAAADVAPEAAEPEDDEDQDDEDQDDDDEDEPFCTECGADVGIFIGHGDAWLHYTGEGTVASPVELYDAGHAPVVAWRPAGAR